MTINSSSAGDMIKTADAGDEGLHLCPACGASVRRRAARYCNTCGRSFAIDDDYAPVDLLRASYHAQHSSPASRVVHRRRAADRSARPQPASRRAASSFIPRQNRAAAFALASIVYAMIPLLGIIFCFPAIAFGGWGALAAGRRASLLINPERDGRRAARFSFFAGWLLLCLQLFLWWMLAHARGF